MARTPNPAQKAALLEAFVDYVIENGMSDLSLRPAAAAIGTSPRMLLYYFGSKEGLIAAAIRQAREREMAMFAIEAQKWGATSSTQVFQRIWAWYASERRAPYMRFFFEVYGVALQHPKMYREFLETVGSDFQSFTEVALGAQGIDRREAKVLATVYIGTLRGLLFDLLTTRERWRINAALSFVADVLDRRLRSGSRAPRRRATKARRARRRR